MYDSYVKNVSAEQPLYLWESFIAVMEEKTLQRAAIRLKTTQPTVTRHLHQLEESLPLKLFELRGRTKTPTPFAEEIYRRISSRLKSLPDEIQTSLKVYAEEESYMELKIGAPEAAIPALCRLPFRGKLVLKSVSAEDTDLAGLDILISPRPRVSDSFLTRKLPEKNFALIVPKKFHREDLTLKAWKSKMQKYPRAVHFAERNTLKPESPVNFEAADWQALEARAAAQLSWAIIPASYVRPQGGYGSKILTDTEYPAARLYLHSRKDLSTRKWFKNSLRLILETLAN